MKVGLDIGVIGPEIFTMLMVMAVLTTLMTTPLLIAFTRPTRRQDALAQDAYPPTGNRHEQDPAA
jgi:hypothetical protein